MSVHAFLVTAELGAKMDFWALTAAYANWIEGRENGPGRETWQVMCMGRDVDAFLAAARGRGNITVQEIEGVGEHENYLLRVGEPGTGVG